MTFQINFQLPSQTHTFRISTRSYNRSNNKKWFAEPNLEISSAKLVLQLHTSTRSLPFGCPLSGLPTLSCQLNSRFLSRHHGQDICDCGRWERRADRRPGSDASEAACESATMHSAGTRHFTDSHSLTCICLGSRCHDDTSRVSGVTATLVLLDSDSDRSFVCVCSHLVPSRSKPSRHLVVPLWSDAD